MQKTFITLPDGSPLEITHAGTISEVTLKTGGGMVKWSFSDSEESGLERLRVQKAGASLVVCEDIPEETRLYLCGRILHAAG